MTSGKSAIVAALTTSSTGALLQFRADSGPRGSSHWLRPSRPTPLTGVLLQCRAHSCLLRQQRIGYGPAALDQSSANMLQFCADFCPVRQHRIGRGPAARELCSYLLRPHFARCHPREASHRAPSASEAALCTKRDLVCALSLGRYPPLC